MLQLNLTNTAGPLKVLCLGAHADDIEIRFAPPTDEHYDTGHFAALDIADHEANLEPAFASCILR